MANAVTDEIDKAVCEFGRGTYGALRVSAELGHSGGAPYVPLGPPGRAQAQVTHAAEVPYKFHDDHVAGALTQDSTDCVWIANVTQLCVDASWLDLRFALDGFH